MLINIYTSLKEGESFSKVEPLNHISVSSVATFMDTRGNQMEKYGLLLHYIEDEWEQISIIKHTQSILMHDAEIYFFDNYVIHQLTILALSEPVKQTITRKRDWEQPQEIAFWDVIHY